MSKLYPELEYPQAQELRDILTGIPRPRQSAVSDVFLRQQAYTNPDLTTNLDQPLEARILAIRDQELAAARERIEARINP